MLNKIEQALAAFAAFCVLGLCVVITGTVLTRSLLGWSIPDDVAIVRELMVGAIVLPLALVTASRSHIAVEFFYNRMGRRTQLVLLAFGTVFGFLALLPILYAAWREFAYAVESEAYFFGELELPEWPGKFAFFVGLFFFILRLAVLMVVDLAAALRGSGPGGSGSGEAAGS